MKKILVMALAAVSALAVNAKDYTVYSNGALSEGVKANYWWNLTQNTQAADPAGSDAKTWSLTFADFPTGPNFCGGLAVPAGTEVAGPLATATLTFKYYATTPCKITVQLGADGVNSTQVINVADADAKVWKEATYSMATDFSAAAEKFAAYAADGAADLLGLIVENFSSTEGSETVLYINDVVFKNIDESWAKPEVEKPFCPVANVPAVKAEDVVSLYSSFGIAPHNVGGWGQSTVAKDLQDDNNNPVYWLSHYNYLGWELNPRLDISDMEYLHIEVYPTTQTTIGVTPSAPEKKSPHSSSTSRLTSGMYSTSPYPLGSTAKSVSLQTTYSSSSSTALIPTPPPAANSTLQTSTSGRTPASSPWLLPKQRTSPPTAQRLLMK